MSLDQHRKFGVSVPSAVTVMATFRSWPRPPSRSQRHLMGEMKTLQRPQYHTRVTPFPTFSSDTRSPGLIRRTTRSY